jgi:GR25 family glycosyltransferase involved in LPS biosynthesis
MHRINKEFDKVVCINLVNRQDKQKEMRLKFYKYDIEVEWFNAVPYGFAKQIVDSLPSNIGQEFPRFNKKTPNELGAAISHYTVIKSALLEGKESIFVFEDDVMFRKDFNEKFDKYFDALPDDWDMIMLYSFMYDLLPENVRVNSKWIKSYRSWSLMSYGMNKKAMEKYIQEQDRLFRIADLASYQMQGKDINVYSSVPTLCIPNQKLGSNIRGENMNYIQTNTILNMGYSNNNFE